MKKTKILILIILSFGYVTKSISQNEIYIEYDKLYGELNEGIPKKGTLINQKNKEGKIIGIGKMAVSENGISNLKFNLWKEYNSEGILLAEGNYKISSYIDCGIGGAERVFYYYRFGKWKYFEKNRKLKFELNFTPKYHSLNTRCQGGETILFGILETIPLEYLGIIEIDEIYELQKVSYNDSYGITTMIPLNGKVYYENE